MSQSKQTKLLTIKIQPSDEMKALIADHKDDMSHTRAAIELYNRQAERNHPRSITGGLLAAMQNTAANDAPQPELKQLGQWVFEGQPDHIKSAAVDMYGRGFYYRYEKSQLIMGTCKRYFIDNCCDFSQIDGVFDSTNWQNSAIDRETVNDVDYLSNDLDESVQAIDDAIDQSDWLSESVPQITQADMQLIFIKNLSECLIQRMQSMDRFSEDDYAIGGDKLMPWDIVANPKGDFAVITGHNQDKRYFGGLYFVPYARGNHAKTVAGERANEYLKTLEFCTITESQLPAFRAALEACYA
ncbi:hypothetical protein [Psychrobacter sp. AT9]|uniref:hypothetical protein n=1 Tax=Psychrobacter sp. AT9 TaxID=3242893 RepID=UPI0039A5B3C4